MKSLYLLLALIFPTSAIAGTNDFRCLVSTNTKSAIRLQFTFPDKWQINAMGSVRYEKGSRPIRVKLISRDAVEMEEGRPYEVTSQWQEVLPNGKGGLYEMVSQGAIIYSFRYIDPLKKREVEFINDDESFNETSCRW